MQPLTKQQPKPVPSIPVDLEESPLLDAIRAYLDGRR